ncbi:MAG: ATP phosphoribosyltransferase regulatory subunit, partial [Lactobacillus iners]|nr:ATP phosphoribosyltransferase regulatory subunit [Lactobacillus iners]
MRVQKPKGTVDILPDTSYQWDKVENIAKNFFRKANYQEIRTPMFENYEIFSRSSGESSDVVEKEMYDFMDKGDRHIALRPEGTAGVVRAYVENKLYGPEYPKPYNVFYIASMFRYERPQAGRQREFHQIGVESFGSDNALADVETIVLAHDLLSTLGIKKYEL